MAETGRHNYRRHQRLSFPDKDRSSAYAYVLPLKYFTKPVLRQALPIGTLLTACSIAMSVLIRYCLGMDLSKDTILIRTAATATVAFPVSFIAIERIQRLETAYSNLLKETRRLSREANSDPLTGLLNRRSFERQLDNALNHRSGGKFVVADIDYLKTINDAYGHVAGDEAIIAVGTALTTLLGDEAIIARMGGDEFCAFVPNGRQIKADQMTERLTDLATELFAQRTGIRGFTLSTSIGVHRCTAGSTFRELLLKTDASLYRNKRQRP